MVRNIFDADIKGMVQPVNISPLTQGQATQRVDTTTADAIKQVGGLAFQAGKAYLKHSAANDAKEASDWILKGGAATATEDVESGKVDPLEEMPEPVRDFIDGKKDRLEAVREARRQGSTTSDTMAAMVAHSTIQQASAYAPGWGDEIQKHAIDKLGYDPGGRLMAQAEARRERAAKREDTLYEEYLKANIDPHAPDAYSQLMEHFETSRIEEKTAASLDRDIKEARLLKLQAEAGQISQETNIAEQTRLRKKMFITSLKAAQQGLNVRARTIVRNLNANVNADGGLDPNKVEEHTAIYQKARAEAADLKREIARLEAGSVGLYKDNEANRLLAIYKAQYDILLGVLDTYEPNKLLKHGVDIKKNTTMLNMLQDSPTMAIVLTEGFGDLAKTAWGLSMLTKVQEEMGQLHDDNNNNNSGKGGLFNEQELRKYLDSNDLEMGEGDVTPTSITFATLPIRIARKEGMLKDATVEDLSSVFAPVLKQLGSTNSQSYKSEAFLELVNEMSQPATRESFHRWFLAQPEAAQNEAREVMTQAQVIASGVLYRNIKKSNKVLLPAYLEGQYGKKPVFYLSSDGMSLEMARKTGGSSMNAWVPGYRQQDHAMATRLRRGFNNNLAFHSLLPQDTEDLQDVHRNVVATLVATDVGRMTYADENSTVPMVFDPKDHPDVEEQLTTNSEGVYTSRQLIDGNLYVHQDGQMIMVQVGVPKNLIGEYGLLPKWPASIGKFGEVKEVAPFDGRIVYKFKNGKYVTEDVDTPSYLKQPSKEFVSE